MSFKAPWPLDNGHVQTVLGSTGRRWIMPRREADFLSQEAVVDITVPDGATLRSKVNEVAGAPLVVLIHGWLGCDHSSYVLSAAAHLHRSGFTTARINLRDHGDTEALNEEMYHSALTQEIAELALCLGERFGGAGTGVMGYSLGGNFALRVARETGLPTLAICPAVDPVRTMHQIDHGASIYRHYFLGKWRRSLQAKAQAFPDRYDFNRAYTLNSVQALTDYFVRYHSEFPSVEDYFSRYDLSGSALEGVTAQILVAEDDPVIPVSQFDGLPSSLEIHRIAGGGHGSFVKDYALNSWCDDYARRWAEEQISAPAVSEASIAQAG